MTFVFTKVIIIMSEGQNLLTKPRERLRLFPLKGVIIVTVLETLALLSLIATIIFGILQYIKK